MRNYIKKLILIIGIITITFSGQAQKKELSGDQFFKNDFKGIIDPLPGFSKWEDDTHLVIIRNGKYFVVDCKTGEEKEYQTPTINKGSVVVLPKIVIKGNDLYETKNLEDIQLTTDEAQEKNPIVSPDGKYVAFTKNNDLYTIDLFTKEQHRLTEDGSETILNGYASWLYMEEILGRTSEYCSFWWGPDSKKIAFFRMDDSQVPIFTITDINNDSHGSVVKERYPKPGDPNPSVKIGVVSPEGGSIAWADFDENEDQYFGKPFWTPDGKSLVVKWLNRGQGHLKLWLVNSSTGSKNELYNEKQKTWIKLQDGIERVRILNDNTNCIIESDKTGWNHLYLINMSTKEVNPITTGKFTVLEVKFIDEKNNIVYFMARGKESTARVDFYKINFDGKNIQRLSFGEYNHPFINVSPGGSYFITSYNNINTPQKLALVDNKGKIVKELGNSKGKKFDDYRWAKTELIRVKSDDNLYDLPMKVIWPQDMDKNKEYPVLISIYGGPNAGTCWDSWILTGNQQWYAKEGLIQVVMDHRGSGHFGKEGQSYMHKNLGYWELKDYSTMVKWLIDNGNADPKKICITGFSYGGYVTCLALTKGSDLFTHGMAGGSVTDWKYYDSHYAERYMGTPKNNYAGYAASSVLNYVNQYKGVLQIVHGISDDNVHMQNSIALISKLQDIKKDFEFMAYSNSKHGWKGTDKDAHFENLKIKFIYKYLLEKEVPKNLLK